MIHLFSKRKTEWQIKIRVVFFAPYRVEEINLIGKTRKKAYKLLRSFMKKTKNYALVEYLSCEEVPIN